MKLNEVHAKQILDSRKKPTVKIIINRNISCSTSAPSGKSKGKYEVKDYKNSLKKDIEFINSINKNKKLIEKIKKIEISEFNDIKKIEELLKNYIGANTLFAIEASILKVLAKKNKKQLWEFLSEKNIKEIKFPYPVGNVMGGGLHTNQDVKPDFQEFLLISYAESFKERVKQLKKIHKGIKEELKTKKTNDEGAIISFLENEKTLKLIKKHCKNPDIKMGIDIAASSFFKNKNYYYKNPKEKLSKQKQERYCEYLISLFDLKYLEDPLEENDFSGFSRILKKCKEIEPGCLIVGDDLTTTNLNRLKRAIKRKSINAIIIKPNQIGSLIEVKKVIDLSKKNNIKTIISHRSGETKDNTIADLSIAWQCDYIKTGIYGKVRESKLKRLIKIEKQINKRLNKLGLDELPNNKFSKKGF